MLAPMLLAAVMAANGSSTTVPFTLFDNRMLVAVSLDGKGPFSMIVDTGSSSLVITPSVARRLGLAPRSAGYAYGAGSGSSALAQTRVPSVAIGSLRFRNVSTDVIDLSPIRRAFRFPALDGVIGYSTLRRFRMGVDMDASRLTLSGSPLAFPKSASAVSFTVDADGLIRIPAAVDGVHGTFVVDTGDRSSLTLFRHFAQANDFYRDATVRNVVTGYGVGGPIYSDLMRTTVALFGSTVPGVLTRASRDKGGAFALGRDAASIGMGLLKRFNVIYDYPDGEIYAWPNRSFAAADTRKPLAYDRGALPPLARHAVFGAGVAQGSGGVRVTFVAAAGPAEAAGVRAGDTIRAIGGTPVDTVAAFLVAVHDLHAGDHIAIDVVRDGTPLRLSALLAAAPDESDSGLVTRYGEIAVDDSLRRTLVTMPQGLASPAPAVLLIGGIGCYSVDVAKNPQDAYLHLAHDLARAGFVTMRVEKSGIGDSQGPPCRSVDFDSEVRGYTAALAALQRDPRVNPARIYLLGHSIGTIIAPRLAVQNRIAGVIVLEAVARDWPEYEIRNLRRQLELDGETPAAVDQALLEKAQCMQRLLYDGEAEAEIERSLPSCSVHNGIYPVSTAYVQQIAHLNLVEPWAQLGVPVLAIYGDSDFETELADHQRIVTIVNAAHPGAATLTVIPAMSHGLGHAATPRAAEDDDDKGVVEQYDADVSAAIVAWLRGLN
jgi:predicted aspartyl protease/alpha-beta hydrolase superfamily lysophospholipase